MIDDLVFKGKSIDEALSKASNFFDVPVAMLNYDLLEEAPQEEVWIKLIENPIMSMRQPYPVDNGYAPNNDRGYAPRMQQGRGNPQGRPQQPRQQQQRRPDNRHSAGPVRNQGRNNPRGGGQQGGGKWGNRRPQQDRRNQGFSDNRRRDNFRPPRDNWKPIEIDLTTLNDFEKEAYQFVNQVMQSMDLKVQVQPVQDQARTIFNIDGPDRGILLNRKGEPLVAIQYLVNKIYVSRDEENRQIYIDSMGYRVARDEELREIALSSAAKVKAAKNEYILSPMNPYERRQIHIALKEDANIETESEGDGYIKRVAIKYTENKKQVIDEESTLE